MIEHFVSLEKIVSFVQVHEVLAYVILFLSMVFEGDTFLIISGVLSHLGALSFWFVLAISFIGAMIGDVLWYALGVVCRRFNFAERPIRGFEKILHKLLPQFRERPLLSLILAKYIYGTNHATLILSGVIGMPFRFFFKAQLIASGIWVLLLTLTGYAFGFIALTLTKNVSLFFLLVFLFFIFFNIVEKYTLRRYEDPLDDTERMREN